MDRDSFGHFQDFMVILEIVSLAANIPMEGQLGFLQFNGSTIDPGRTDPTQINTSPIIHLALSDREVVRVPRIQNGREGTRDLIAKYEAHPYDDLMGPDDHPACRRLCRCRLLKVR